MKRLAFSSTPTKFVSSPVHFNEKSISEDKERSCLLCSSFISKDSSFYNVKTQTDLVNNITCILEEPLVLHSNLVCRPCFRRVELLRKKENVLKSLKEEFRTKYAGTKAARQRTGTVATAVHKREPQAQRTKRLSTESPASTKSFLTKKLKTGCKKNLELTAEVNSNAETEENFSIFPLDGQGDEFPQTQSGLLSRICGPPFISAVPPSISTKNVQESENKRTDTVKVRYFKELMISIHRKLCILTRFVY